jgi:hypothetical protein
MKHLDDPIWNRTRDLPVCSAVPQANLYVLISKVTALVWIAVRVRVFESRTAGCKSLLPLGFVYLKAGLQSVSHYCP